MNRMKLLREEQQITMKEAARRLNLPYTTYVNYEKSLREPNSETLIQIANFYNCSIDYLLGKSNNRVDDIEDMHLTITGTDPQLDELNRNANQLNAQGLQKLVDYSDDLLGNPVYRKKTPDGFSISDGRDDKMA